MPSEKHGVIPIDWVDIPGYDGFYGFRKTLGLSQN